MEIPMEVKPRERKKVTLYLNSKQVEYVEKLLSTGLCGCSVEEVCERLVCRGIEASVNILIS